MKRLHGFCLALLCFGFRHIDDTDAHNNDDRRQRVRHRHPTNTTTINHTNPTARIVGGTIADASAYPFFTNWRGCGASLIHRDMLLTAAHCNAIRDNDVRVGAFYRRVRPDGENTDNADERTIVKRIPHPDYDSDTFENDFMLLKLNEPSDKTSALLNGDTTDLSQNQILTVIGMGLRRENGGSASQYLEEVDVEAIPLRKCNAFWSYGGDVDAATMFCAGDEDGLKDSCQGDSGGPILLRNDNNTFTQLGVTSWGYGCARKNFPGVYAKVSSAKQWIEEQICRWSDFKPDTCPPATPTLGGGGSTTPAEFVQIKVEILTDRYPAEIGYTIQDPTFDTIDVEQDSFADRSTLYTHEYVVDALGQTVIFTITDSASDGICCKYGRGEYRVIVESVGNVDDIVIDWNGEYQGSEATNFTLPTSTSESSSTSSSTTIMIEITLDDKPEEVGWTIQTNNNVDGIVASAPIGTYRSVSPLSTVTEEVTIETAAVQEDTAFTMVVVDQGADGGSSFQVYTTGNSGGLLAYSNEHYGMASVHAFRI